MKYLSFKKFLNVQQPFSIILSIYPCPFYVLKEENQNTGVNCIYNELDHTVRYRINLKRFSKGFSKDQPVLPK